MNTIYVEKLGKTLNEQQIEALFVNARALRKENILLKEERNELRRASL